MVATEQQLRIDRETPLTRTWTGGRAAAERAARESLRAQVARLECELSGIVARGFPHISPAPPAPPEGAGPRLLSLAELERARDRLVVCLRGAQEQARVRAELELRARDQLERMRLEPGRYRFVRLHVTDLGERGCGVWEVRPRLGLIGMLAGWWQLKLSSGCPLPQPRARGARLPIGRPSSAAERGDRPLLAAHRGERVALAVGERAKGLGFGHLQLREQLAAAALAPAALAH